MDCEQLEFSGIEGVNIRGVPLPTSVRGCVLPNEDGTFDIYYNSRLDRDACRRAVEHELRHIGRGHLYDSEPVAQNELEAEK